MSVKGVGSQAVFAAGLFVVPHTRMSGRPPGLLSLGLVAVVILLPLALFRLGGSNQTPPEQEGGDDWGSGPDPPQPPPSRPHGGIPLDDAIPARTRLRGAGRLAHHRQARDRRPAREPSRRPQRVTLGRDSEHD